MARKLQMHGRRLTRSSGHKEALYRGLVTDLLGYEKITTTEAKAKAIRGLAEKMITLGKKGNLTARRQALSFIYDEEISRKVFDELAKRYAERNGGYTRMVKLGPRQGDGAAIVQLELVK
jgi:large subunit ribosomal protein L17